MSFPKRSSGGPGRYTADEVRAALEADAEARGVGVVPLVIECRRTGEWGEVRPPGVYYEDPERRVSPTIVFDGDEPPESLVNRFRPKGGGPGPLLLVLGPEHIDPPAEDVGP
ncbi:hypothetical protein R5W23_005485 [Gemmata sp. JC673]|uniref:Uncharacterized protein n=1 Tax=Gemmata algarum TaxID=2975278 RepID=A0ABU5EVA6_9BACT|nr:hypothetical protein [Gemmata algarum]MDY3558392.1 hypothetical protein [Gemmata algarum]